MASEAARVEVRNVSRWYGDVVAVNDISFGLEPGITGLLGPNGAGKSTMLHMIAGFLRPSAGAISVLGASAWRNPDIFRRVGLVPERESVYPFLGAHAFALASARLHGLADPEDAARRAIARVELEDAQDRPMSGYSKGMRQRAKIAASARPRPRRCSSSTSPSTAPTLASGSISWTCCAAWPPRAARSSSPRTSWRKSNGWPRRSSSSSTAASPRPETSIEIRRLMTDRPARLRPSAVQR